MITWNVYTDGGCRTNPGPGAWSFVIFDDLRNVVVERSGFIKHATNNHLEYEAFIRALEFLEEQRIDSAYKLKFYSDSMLLVEQVNGRWKANDGDLYKWFENAVCMFHRLRQYTHVELNHVPRSQNTHADKLCNIEQDLHYVEGVKRKKVANFSLCAS